METKDDINMIAQTLKKLAVREDGSYSDTRRNRHMREPETEDIYGFEDKSFAKQSPEPNSYDYEYENNFAESDPPRSNQLDIDHQGIPIAISKHNNHGIHTHREINHRIQNSIKRHGRNASIGP